MNNFLQFKSKQGKKLFASPYWPIGSIYLSVSNTNPNNWFGGTWEQIAKGRTLIGVDPEDDDFETVKKTGGEKKHTLTSNELPEKLPISYGPISGGTDIVISNTVVGTGGQRTGQVNLNLANTGIAHNNLQPYFTCYMWQRIA